MQIWITKTKQAFVIPNQKPDLESLHSISVLCGELTCDIKLIDQFNIREIIDTIIRKIHEFRFIEEPLNNESVKDFSLVIYNNGQCISVDYIFGEFFRPLYPKNVSDVIHMLKSLAASVTPSVGIHVGIY